MHKHIDKKCVNSTLSSNPKWANSNCSKGKFICNSKLHARRIDLLIFIHLKINDPQENIELPQEYLL